MTMALTQKRHNQSKAEALHEQRGWLPVILSSIGDAVITTDIKGCVTFLNLVAESLTAGLRMRRRAFPSKAFSRSSMTLADVAPGRQNYCSLPSCHCHRLLPKPVVELPTVRQPSGVPSMNWFRLTTKSRDRNRFVAVC